MTKNSIILIAIISLTLVLPAMGCSGQNGKYLLMHRKITRCARFNCEQILSNNNF